MLILLAVVPVKNRVIGTGSPDTLPTSCFYKACGMKSVASDPN
jgi:hypothetical protein